MKSFFLSSLMSLAGSMVFVSVSFASPEPLSKIVSPASIDKSNMVLVQRGQGGGMRGGPRGGYRGGYRGGSRGVYRGGARGGARAYQFRGNYRSSGSAFRYRGHYNRHVGQHPRSLYNRHSRHYRNQRYRAVRPYYRAGRFYGHGRYYRDGRYYRGGYYRPRYYGGYGRWGRTNWRWYRGHYYYDYLPMSILFGGIGYGLFWAWGQDGYIPADAVYTDYGYGYPVYVCRAYYRGKYRTGRLYSGRGCTIYYNGRNVTLRKYRVLVRD